MLIANINSSLLMVNDTILSENSTINTVDTINTINETNIITNITSIANITNAPKSLVDQDTTVAPDTKNTPATPKTTPINVLRRKKESDIKMHVKKISNGVWIYLLNIYHKKDIIFRTSINRELNQTFIYNHIDILS